MKVQRHTNEIWWLTQACVSPTMVSEIVDDIESRLEKSTRAKKSSHRTKVQIRVSARTNLEVVAGDRNKEKVGFVSRRDRLEMHLDTVWPGLADVLEKKCDEKELLVFGQFDRLVSTHGYKLHDTEDVDW